MAAPSIVQPVGIVQRAPLHRIISQSANIGTSTEFLLLKNMFDPAVELALCPARIVREVPDLEENLMGVVASLLKEKHHGVFIFVGQLCTDRRKDINDAVHLCVEKSYKLEVSPSRSSTMVVVPCLPVIEPTESTVERKRESSYVQF